MYEPQNEEIGESNSSQNSGSDYSVGGSETLGDNDDEISFEMNENECGRNKKKESTAGKKRRRVGEIGHQERWEQMYSRLLKFRQKNGHCVVPNRHHEDPQLGTWVATQRRQYKILTTTTNQSTPMTLERARRLEEIGFEWAPKDLRAWDVRFNELVSFVATHGHAQVPMKTEENSTLSNWVSTQRQEYRLMKKGLASRLTAERIKKLDSVGFIWEAKRGPPTKSKKESLAATTSVRKADPPLGAVDFAFPDISHVTEKQAFPNEGKALSAAAVQPWEMNNFNPTRFQNSAMAVAQQELQFLRRDLQRQGAEANSLANTMNIYNTQSGQAKIGPQVSGPQSQQQASTYQNFMTEQFSQFQQTNAARNLEGMWNLSSHSAAMPNLPATQMLGVQRSSEQLFDQSNQSVFSIPAPDTSDLHCSQRLPHAAVLDRFHDIESQGNPPLQAYGQQQRAAEGKDFNFSDYLRSTNTNPNTMAETSKPSATDDKKPSAQPKQSNNQPEYL